MAHFVRPVAGHLCLAICTVRQAKRLMIVSSESNSFIAGINDSAKIDQNEFRPASLADILRFAKRIRRRLLNRIGNSMLTVCAGRNPDAIANTVLALGGYLIMYGQSMLQEIEELFNPILREYVESIQAIGTSSTRDVVLFRDYWLAMSHARFHYVCLNLGRYMHMSKHDIFFLRQNALLLRKVKYPT